MEHYDSQVYLGVTLDRSLTYRHISPSSRERSAPGMPFLATWAHPSGEKTRQQSMLLLWLSAILLQNMPVLWGNAQNMQRRWILCLTQAAVTSQDVWDQPWLITSICSLTSHPLTWGELLLARRNDWDKLRTLYITSLTNHYILGALSHGKASFHLLTPRTAAFLQEGLNSGKRDWMTCQ